jgi:hypothetical protein
MLILSDSQITNIGSKNARKKLISTISWRFSWRFGDLVANFNATKTRKHQITPNHFLIFLSFINF